MIVAKFPHISYSISYTQLFELWIETFHNEEYVLAIYDPLNHTEYIKNLGMDCDPDNVYEGKILAVQFGYADDAIAMCKSMSHEVGPYVQLWALGKYITDNIEK